MAEATAILGYGSLFQVQTEDSPDTFETLAELTNITPVSFTVDEIDISHMLTQDFREFESGLVDTGECVFDMNFIPGSPTEQRLWELLNIPISQDRRRNCRIVFPNDVVWSFSAEMIGYEPVVPFDDKMSTNATFRIAGTIDRVEPEPEPEDVWFTAFIDDVNMLYAAGNGEGLVHGLQPPDFSVLLRDSGSKAVWSSTSGGNFTLTTGQPAPDGTNTATKLVADTSNTFHAIFQQVQRQAQVAITFRAAAFLKAGGYTRAAVVIQDGVGNGALATFDLAGGQIGVANAAVGSGWTAGSADIVSFGDGWYLCWIDATTSTATAVQFQVSIDSGSGTGANSFNFAGNGSDGILMWRCNLMPAAAWTAMTGDRVFFDDFASSATTDLTDSRAAGFNWYLHNAWPSAHATFPVWHTVPATQSGDLTFGSSQVTLTEDRSSFGSVLQSAATDGASGYVGATYALPNYFEASASWDPALATGGGGSVPIFWVLAVEFLIGNTDRFVENDFFEAASPGGDPDGVLHDWPANQVVQSLPFDNSSAVFINQNIYGHLWLTQAVNGGTWGLSQRFFNGIAPWNSDVAYRSVGDSSPTGGLSGVFSPGDSQNFVMVLGCGDTWPCTFDYVAVYE